MPELPELEAFRLRLGPRLEGRVITGVEVSPKKGFMFRYPIESFEQEAPYRRLREVARRGKHMVFQTELVAGGEARALVVNPMLGGRFQVAGDEEPRPQAWVFSLRLDGGEELRYLDFRDMGRLYWVRELTEVPGWAALGPEPDELVAAGIEAFRKRLRRFRDELKDLLRNQEFMAGVGNAYSDEILWEARLLPLRRRSSLTPEDEESLFAALPAVLDRAVHSILAKPDYDESKQDRSFMAVHMKGGKDCPRCGHRISQLGSNREPTNFCRGCQK